MRGRGCMAARKRGEAKRIGAPRFFLGQRKNEEDGGEGEEEGTRSRKSTPE